MARPAVSVSADAREFVALVGKASKLEPKLRTELRKRLKAEGEKAASKVRDEVRKPPGTIAAQPRHTGLRDAIASGVEVKVPSGERSRRVGVFITSTGKGLAGDRRKLARRWNAAKGWRHPVFAGGKIRDSKAKLAAAKARGGGRLEIAMLKGGAARARASAKWVTQKGRPYFGVVIMREQEHVAAGVRRALDDAAKTLK